MEIDPTRSEPSRLDHALCTLLAGVALLIVFVYLPAHDEPHPRVAARHEMVRTTSVRAIGAPARDPAPARSPRAKRRGGRTVDEPRPLGLRDLAGASASIPAPRVSPGTGAGPMVEVGSLRARGDRSANASLGDAGFVRGRNGELVYHEPAGHFDATLLPDGRVHFQNRHLRPRLSQTSINLPDLYSVVRKAQGGELWARAKAQLLERTFEPRLELAIAFAERNIDRRSKELPHDLLEIWNDTARPASARRETLFERWDECTEGFDDWPTDLEHAEPSRIDALRATAGRHARDQIARFIRAHLPRGSADAYDTAELAELNRRRVSAEPFAPYDRDP